MFLANFALVIPIEATVYSFKLSLFAVKILSKMPSGKAYTLLMAIMTDEMKHANKYNFLIATMPNNS